MAAPKKYPDKLRARAVRLYRESNPKPVIRRLAEQLLGVAGKWLIERGKTKRARCHEENVTLRRAMELTFTQQLMEPADQDA